MTTLKAGAATDVGRVRHINEDRFLVDDGLFAVADGVGGHQAGEVAAQTSIEELKRSFTERTTDGLVDAVEKANRAVWQLAQSNREKRGMGTTITAVALVDDDGQEHLALANVGDSRAYVLQRGELVQLTEDHSLVEELVREGQITHEEAMVHPQRSIITRALGMEPEINVDYWQLIPYRGDRLLLCTDGLTNEVSDDRIASTLRKLADPEQAARDLVRQARANGGSDNVTVVVIDIVDDGGRGERASEELGTTSIKQARGPATAHQGDAGPPRAEGSEPARAGTATATAARPPGDWRQPTRDSAGSEEAERRRFLTWRVAAFVTLLAIIAVVVISAIGWYARSAYFVGLDGDQVAIFRGRPGGMLWFEPTLHERKSLTVHDVLPSRVRDLRAGKERATKADADRYVNNLRQEAAEAARAAVPVPGPAPGPAPDPNTTSTSALPPPP